MAKFPSQRKLQYAHAAAVSNDGWTTLTTRNAANDGTVSGYVNLPKDLSILNRRGYASTTRKGVPLVFRCKVDLFLQDEDGFGLDAAVGTDFCTTLKIDGVQNNWVIRNAAVKWHAAREKMFRDAGIKRSERGAYSHEIRYNYDSNADSWVQPTDGSGDPFTGGTWDVSKLAYSEDDEFELSLIGVGDAEDTDAFAGNYLTLGHSYLMSRAAVPEDTNEELDSGPAKFSVLQKMLSPMAQSDGDIEDDVIDEARDAQDNPPYDTINLASAQDLYNDVTEPVELGRAIAGLGNAFGSVVVDIPFGICNMRLTHYDAVDTNVTSSPCIALEVLDIFEMQG